MKKSSNTEKEAKKTKNNRNKLIIIILSLFIALVIMKFLELGPTGFVVFQTITEANFNEGIYNETIYNATTLAVQLNVTVLFGNYTSKVIDAGSATNWRNLSWSENITNRSGNVSFKIRSCLTANCQEKRPFVGPDNTTNTFFIQGNYSLLNNTITPDSRYLQYMAFFSALDNDSNVNGPILYNVSIDYGACIEPTNDMFINENTTLCFGTYYINDTNGDSSAITISKDSVFVTCNKTILVGNLSSYGFYLSTRSYVTISDCNMFNYTNAIRLDSSNFTTISENNITNTTSSAIRLDLSHHNIINNNSIVFNSYTTFTANDNSYYVYSSSGSNNTIKNNLFLNSRSLQLASEYNTTIVNNTISNSSSFGIEVSNSINVTIYNNTISSNGTGSIQGIYFSNVTKSLVYSNVITYNYWSGLSGNYAGIYLSSSNNNTIYNNLINYTWPAFDNGTNSWNTSNYSGTNIIGGAMIGGNYYSDYSYYDENGDGIGELSYTAGMTKSYDALPLSNSNCIVPANNQQIQRPVVLCSGTFTAIDNNNDGFINVTNSSVIVACNSTRMVSDGTGILINSNPSTGQLTNITIKDCYFETTATAIKFINTSHSYITGNTVNMSSNNIVFSLNNVNNSIISNNTITNTSNSPAMDILGASNSIFENNTILKIDGVGLLFESIPSRNVTVKSNIMNGIDRAGMRSSISVNDSKFYNNTLTNISGITSPGCIDILGFNNEFIGNRLVNCSSFALRSGSKSSTVIDSGHNYYVKSNMISITDALNAHLSIQMSGSNITILNNTIDVQSSFNGRIRLHNINNSYIINNTIINTTISAITISASDLDYELSPLSSSSSNSNITITGNKIIARGNGMLLVGSNFTVYNNTLFSELGVTSTMPGIEAIALNNSIIFNNTIYRFKDGIALYNSENSTITNNTLYNNTAYGLNITNSRNISIIRNIMYNNSKYGALILNSLNATISTNIIFNNSIYGISANSSNYTIITNNTIRNNIFAGISVFGSNNSRLFNNSLFYNRDAIYIEDSDGLAAFYNLMQNNSGYGIYELSSYNTTIFENVISNSSLSAIMLLNSLNVTIEKNTIFNNSIYGISANSSNYTIITNNTIRNNIFAGISVFGSNNSRLFNNSLFYNRDAIYIEDTNIMSILYNTIQNSSRHSIYATESSNITISSNTLANNSNAAIYLLKSINNTIAYNEAYNNTIAGIMLNSTNYSIIENNNLSYNGKASTPSLRFYATAVSHNYTKTGAIFTTTTGAVTGAVLVLKNGSSTDINTNSTDVSSGVNGTENMHMALVTINSSVVGFNHWNYTFFFDRSVATNCAEIAAYASDILLSPYATESTCTYFQSNMFTANGAGSNYTYNGLTNSSIIIIPGYISPPSMSVESSSETFANILVYESSENNITNNTLTASEGYGIIFDSAANNTMTNNTILKNRLNAAKSAGDSDLINSIINSTNITTSVSSGILKIYWYLKVLAKDGALIFSNLNISFYNQTGSYAASALTTDNGLGYTPEVMLLEYQHDSSGKKLYTPYTINATRPVTLDPASTTYNLTSSSKTELNLPAGNSGSGGGGGGGGGGGTPPPEGCRDACSLGEKICSSATSYKKCGDYDLDTCSEYSVSLECPSGSSCSNGNCTESCIPNWQCSEWSLCIDGKKSRTCINEEGCINDKPIESLTCPELIPIKEIPLSQREHNATKCFESRGLSDQEIVVLEDLLKMTPCRDDYSPLSSIKTKFRCNGIEISFNDISFNIVYKDKPNFYLNMKSDDEHLRYCPWCFNSKQDYDEAGIDCGGSCRPCDEKTMELPFSPPRPDYKPELFILTSSSAIIIGYLLLFSRIRLH